jgi:hypothetical protein
MSKTPRERGLGDPHPHVPHLYRKVPQSTAAAIYPHLPSVQQIREREREKERDRRDKKDKPSR